MELQVTFPSVLRHCWLGDRKGIQPVKGTACWFVGGDRRFARFVAPAVTTASIILSSNEIQNGDVPVPAKPGPPGKWALERREKEQQ